MLVDCPQCGYSLTGLPAEHRCPECGLAYDEKSEMFKLAGSRALLVKLIVVALALLWGAFQVFAVSRSASRGFGFCWGGFLLIYMAAMVWCAYYIVHHHRRGPMAATMPDALYLRLHLTGEERIPWDRISRAAFNRSTKGATLFMRQTRTTRDITGVFNTPDDAARFVEQVQARIGATRDQSRDRDGAVRCGNRATNTRDAPIQHP